MNPREYGLGGRKRCSGKRLTGRGLETCSELAEEAGTGQETNPHQNRRGSHQPHQDLRFDDDCQPPEHEQKPGIIASSPNPRFPAVFLNIADMGQDSIGFSPPVILFIISAQTDRSFVACSSLSARSIIGPQQSGIADSAVSSAASLKRFRFFSSMILPLSFLAPFYGGAFDGVDGSLRERDTRGSRHDIDFGRLVICSIEQNLCEGGDKNSMSEPPLRIVGQRDSRTVREPGGKP